MLTRDGRETTAARAARVKVIRGRTALSSATYWVEPPPDYDRAGVWRLGGSVALLLGLAALNEARSDSTLPAFDRLVAAGFAGVYAAGGAYALTTPQWIARGVIVHPRWTLAAAFAPLAAEGVSGGARTPLHMLTAASAGASALVYGQRTGARAAQIAGLMWSVQARAAGTSRTRSGPPAAWVHLVLPLTFRIAARLTATFASLAYNARSLDATLRDLGQERTDMGGIAGQLDVALREADEKLRELLPDLGPEQRNLALRALGRLHEAHTTIRIALLQDQEQVVGRVRRRVRQAFRSRRLGERDRPVPARRQSLASICEEQCTALAELVPPGVAVELDVDAQLVVDGVDRIAVLAATVTAGVVNALRHAERLSAIAISAQRLDDGRMQLRIANDGVPDDAPQPQPGNGLGTIERQLARIDGTLVARAPGDGRFELLATLPARTDQQESRPLLPWPRIEARVDELLGETTHLCAAMVAAQLAGQRPRRRDAARALLTLLPPAAYALEERRGRRSPWPLVAAAVATGLARGPQRGLLCGWTNAALARHTRDSRPVQTEALVALNAIALAGSYVRAHNRRPLGGQLATLVVGPLATTRIVRRAIERLRTKESDVIATLSALETVHWIITDLVSRHGCLRPLKQLCGDPQLSNARSMELHPLVMRIANASRTYGEVSERPLSGLVGDVCTVIGRRVWPASLRVEVDLASIGDVDPGLGRMRLRQTAIAVADTVAREMISRRPARFDGSRGVQRVEVHVAGQLTSPTVEFRVRPVIRRDADSERRLCDRIEELGGDVVEWTDGVLTFAVYPTTDSVSPPLDRAVSL